MSTSRLPRKPVIYDHIKVGEGGRNAFKKRIAWDLEQKSPAYENALMFHLRTGENGELFSEGLNGVMTFTANGPLIFLIVLRLTVNIFGCFTANG